MAFDSKEQRRIMGKFATGVTVASTKLGDETWGMTANAVTSLSLDPPLVLLAVVRESQSHAKFKDAGCFDTIRLVRSQRLRRSGHQGGSDWRADFSRRTRMGGL